ncbi:MAG: hypothetical protein HY334_07805 [Armatimonadetes bacterium]|nr:hypothetical protein [Armatimonadota bacterium]
MHTLTRPAPWLIFAGNVTLLLGLAWDARLHSLDPHLAMREGVFTMSNPGHALFAGGVALVVVGTILLLLGQAIRRPGATLSRRAVAVVASAALVMLSALTFTAAVAGEDGRGEAGDVHAATEMTDGSGHEGHGTTPAPAASPAAGPTAEQRAAAAKLLADIRAGIAPYASVNAAVTAGYVQSTPWRFLAWGPAHFTNFAYSRDGRILDPERPESLVYMKVPGGNVALIGAMFSAPTGQGPRPGGTLTDWHTHDNLCITSTGSVAIATGPGQCPAGSFFVGERVEMMHVWTFDNPDGPFSHSLSGEAIRAAVRQLGGR